MTISIIWAFIAAHWHKVVAVIAFAMAVFNKVSHNSLVNGLAARFNEQQAENQKIESKIEQPQAKKSKKHKHKK